METLTSESFLAALGGEPRTCTALLLEAIALRHQIAVLERSGTRRPCFRSLGSTVLDLALVAVAALARKPDTHSAGDGQALAPQGLVWAVEISVR